MVYVYINISLHDTYRLQYLWFRHTLGVAVTSFKSDFWIFGGATPVYYKTVIYNQI